MANVLSILGLLGQFCLLGMESDTRDLGMNSHSFLFFFPIGLVALLPAFTTIDVDSRRKRDVTNDYVGHSSQIYNHLNAALDRFDRK